MAGKEGCFVLLKAPNALRVKDIVYVVIQDGAKPEELGLADLAEPVSKALTRMEEGLAGALDETTIQDLLQSAKPVVNG